MITKNSKIYEVLEKNEDTAKLFFEMGMHCLGCPSARNETIEEACAVHGRDADEMVKKINEIIQAK